MKHDYGSRGFYQNRKVFGLKGNLFLGYIASYIVLCFFFSEEIFLKPWVAFIRSCFIPRSHIYFDYVYLYRAIYVMKGNFFLCDTFLLSLYLSSSAITIHPPSNVVAIVFQNKEITDVLWGFYSFLEGTLLFRVECMLYFWVAKGTRIVKIGIITQERCAFLSV